ncbi:MAG TPA: WXG100 family type VII secretion target [Chloroflexota bacterium]|nr:WXG100 family type VII secretion target [Chloroflexota bacterium]
MAADVVQARYAELDEVAQRFEQLAASNAQLVQRVSGAFASLDDKGWIGLGKDAFQAEMLGVLFPALQRLGDAMSQASSITLAVKTLVQQSEGDASSLFKGGEAWQLLAGNGWSAGSLADGASGASGASGGGIPDWLKGLFVGPGALLSGMAIPLVGPHGIVPAGYTNAGERLFMHFGGSGTDTIYSIHPWTGIGRPPFRLPKPNLRFDYGEAVKAYLPDGTRINVPANENFFHWNVAGAQGQAGGQPLWSSIGSDITHDHQLLTNNPLPRGNIIGEFGGASLVKGASRGLLVVGAAMDAYSIATADNKVKEASRVAGGWGGAWAGAEGGAIAGAAIGSIFPGPGTAIGGAVGGIAGGIGGYIGGSSVGEWVYSLF